MLLMSYRAVTVQQIVMLALYHIHRYPNPEHSADTDFDSDSSQETKMLQKLLLF